MKGISEVEIIARERAIELNGIMLLYILQIERVDISGGSEVEILYHFEDGVQSVWLEIVAFRHGILDVWQGDVFA